VGPVLVTGVARVVTSPQPLVARIKDGDPRLRRMGVPDDLAMTRLPRRATGWR